MIHRVFNFLLIGLLSVSSFAADTEFHGFVDGRFGMRTQNDPYQNDRSLSELRLQLDSLTYFDAAELQVRGDVVYDDLADDIEKVDLENGDGFFDLRELNLLFTPVNWADVKVGRQILTWGTGDLIFINDLFPKDWNSFLLGRDEEYLKAPSDALYVSFFPSFASIDVAYTPQMDADRYINGERISYWGGSGITGLNFDAEERDKWFKDHEITARVYRPVLGFDTALYAYHGFWKSPVGMKPGGLYFPRMNAYGASTKGALGDGLVHAEVGYYDSRENTADDQIRFLTGYEREVAKELTAGAQYYIEHADGEDRHVLTLRLTKMLMNQNLMLSLFTFYSPTDKDAYIRTGATYKISDHWMTSLNGNFFIGKDDDTFFGQFRYNSNINLGVRYSF